MSYCNQTPFPPREGWGLGTFAPVYARWPNPQPHVLSKKGQVTALGNMNIILEQCSALLVGLEITESNAMGIRNERRLSGTNFSSENNLPTFRLNASVVIRARCERC